MDVEVIIYEGNVMGISIPPQKKSHIKVIKTENAVKENTTSGTLKDAAIETGYTLKVPLFIGEGEEIIITTRDYKYSSSKDIL